MDTILRAAAMYFVLLVIFRLAGKRTMSEADVFDFLMLLIISETTQQAMVGDDPSFTNAILLITTLVFITVMLSLIKLRSRLMSKLIDDEPLLVVSNGQLIKTRADKLRVDERDILEAAREIHGLERFEQIKFAVVERNGNISVIPREDGVA
jgi:uncharacterized membrane protein YcaP (DUF421 family)